MRKISWFEHYTLLRRPDLIIGNVVDPYMLRWHLLHDNILSIYLHRFLRSDDDRALHDHVGWNISIILQGEYTEHTIAAGGIHHKVIRRAGDWKFRFAHQAHRIELHNGPCWTLWIRGPKFRKWGFHCKNGWKEYREFDRDNGCG